MQKTTTNLTPLALKDAPALIETIFPAQKVSFEAQQERTSVQSQTLTGLGSYWKGRKPLILVRAIVLASLLPPTSDAEADLALFEKLMAFDDEGLARRALIGNAVSPAEIAARIQLENPWDYFKATLRRGDVTGGDVRWMRFPLDADEEGISLRWQRSLGDDEKLAIYRKLLATCASYEEKASLGKRPEELDQEWLYAPVWAEVNRHYAHLGEREIYLRAGGATGHPALRPSSARGRHLLGWWLHPVRGCAYRLRRLRLRPQPHCLHVDLGQCRNHRRAQ